MKTAEQMMCEWMESEIDQYGKVKLNAKKFYEIYNWYQEVELAERKQNRIDIPGLYDGSLGLSNMAPDTIVKWTGNEDAWKHAHAGGNMYNKRTDTNHAEIRDGLRKAGYVVKDLSRCGEGVPDLLVAGSGRGVMFEIKYGNAKLTDAEKEFHDMFHGLGVYIVRTLEQALEIMRRETI